MKTKRSSRKGGKSPKGREREEISLLEPVFHEPRFESFSDLAQSCDALIAEFYRYYRESPEGEPNLFGFVTVRHVVKFTKETDAIYTENIIGQKTNVIYAPLIRGESKEEQERRRLSLLAAFDHTKRASHILALTLLVGLLRGPAIRSLLEGSEGASKRKRGAP